MKLPRPGVPGRGTVRLSRDSMVVEAQTLTLGRITLRVQRDGRGFTVEVTPDGEGLVSHAGAALLAEAADRLGLTRALSAGLAGCVSAVAGTSPAGSCATW